METAYNRVTEEEEIFRDNVEWLIFNAMAYPDEDDDIFELWTLCGRNPNLQQYTEKVRALIREMETNGANSSDIADAYIAKLADF